MERSRRTESESGLDALRRDPDIAFEGTSLASGAPVTAPTPGAPTGALKGAQAQYYVPLKVVSGSARPTEASAQLVQDVGGLDMLKQFTHAFYEKAFKDPVLDTFIREHGDHHGDRFASWIAEKMGAGTPWTSERRTRAKCPFSAFGHTFNSAFDRSSAHFAAWHSPKREPAKWGDHFKLDDCRIWMRLHFWALRESGAMDTNPRFVDYYCRMIGHFVSVYERRAPPFARESMRWSADPANTQAYLENGRTMPDVHVPLGTALQCLPVSERVYRGSSDPKKTWPYEL